ncbi:energy-coupling factor transporter transmembrane component T family protein [Virgibacillus ndiopensis]|uniref:energy-coupling factor transporter transmembrane component T family protein n=1 Tax=Virgibacillus ndiopensis TaxID=2004408 RepID=UPI000C06DD17|nr:energy-coupling factor transporter transmembrane component T [Virgibacillus ndiopensis]
MFLHNLNPCIKALTIVLLVIMLALIFDPITPFLFMILTVILTFLGGNINWKKYCLYFVPFLVIAFGMLWTTIAFADAPANPHEVISLVGFDVPKESFVTALALAFRVLSVAALSLLFILTTNVVDFILSLIQHLKVSPKIAYGVLAGYRFLPMMKDELAIIRSAHRVRGFNHAKTLREKWNQYKMFSIPLLASSIRKAERTAIAMESKGFTGGKERTFYRRITITPSDWFFLCMMIMSLLGIAYISWEFGYFKWYNGEL